MITVINKTVSIISIILPHFQITYTLFVLNTSILTGNDMAEHDELMNFSDVEYSDTANK